MGDVDAIDQKVNSYVEVTNHSEAAPVQNIMMNPPLSTVAFLWVGGAIKLSSHAVWPKLPRPLRAQSTDSEVHNCAVWGPAAAVEGLTVGDWCRYTTGGSPARPAELYRPGLCCVDQNFGLYSV